MYFVALLTLAALVPASQAWFFSSPDWSSFRVHWGTNVFSSSVFEKMPRTRADAVDDGFRLINQQCEPNSADGPFLGFRYMNEDDPSVILIFDSNGYIAGIQTMFDANAKSYTPSNFNKDHPFITGGGLSGLTAYFVDPNIICSGGRSEDEFDDQGTGTGLYIQNGTNPYDAINIPMTVNEIDQTAWTRGKCFPTMGRHYWYNVRADMNCDEFYPYFLLYNSGKLDGFGFAMNIDIDSRHYEHPTPDDAKRFIAPYPNCLKTDPSFQRLSTMHVYFTSPYLDFC